MRLMRNKTTIVFLLAMLCLALPALAQDKPQKVKTMIDFKKELNLSDQQITNITNTLKSFQENVVAQKKVLVAQESDLRKLLADHANLADIKKKLHEIEATRFELRYLDVVTSRQVEEILSAEQLTAWRNIQTKLRAETPKAK